MWAVIRALIRNPRHKKAPARMRGLGLFLWRTRQTQRARLGNSGTVTPSTPTSDNTVNSVFCGPSQALTGENHSPGPCAPPPTPPPPSPSLSFGTTTSNGIMDLERYGGVYG